jgi:hypothetical protein
MVWRIYQPIHGVKNLPTNSWCEESTNQFMVLRIYQPIHGVKNLPTNLWRGSLCYRNNFNINVLNSCESSLLFSNNNWSKKSIIRSWLIIFIEICKLQIKELLEYCYKWKRSLNWKIISFVVQFESYSALIDNFQVKVNVSRRDL